MPDLANSFAQHLSLLLSVIDLEERLAPTTTSAAPIDRALAVVRRAMAAERVSYFEIEGGEGDEGSDLTVTRVARVAEGNGVSALASFAATRSALLLACTQSSSAEALGPLADDEPFYAVHAEQEPLPTRYAAFASVVVRGQAVGVLEAARGEGGSPFVGDDLRVLEDGAATVAALAVRSRRDQTAEALFAALLPELLTAETAPTQLLARLREWLQSRRMRPAERDAIGLAVAIAELSVNASGGLDLARSIVAACLRAFPEAPPSWREGVHATR